MIGPLREYAWHLYLRESLLPTHPMRQFVPLVTINGWELGTVPGGVGIRRVWTF